MIIRIMIFIFSILLFFSCNEKNNALKGTENKGANNLKDFLFVGMINENPGLYKYNFDNSEYNSFWSDNKEKVVDLSYSEGKKNVFFITARNFVRSGAFPFIKNVRLYLINPETKKADFLEELGSGLQVFAQWEDENTFRIIINSFDNTIANYVNHRIMLFNIYGKKLEDKTAIFDLTKQGYPQLQDRKINFTSPGKKYLIENRDTEVYLIWNETEELIIKSSQQVRQIEWFDNFLFLSSIGIIPGTSKLIIYSLEKKKILKLWEGTGVKNFFLTNDLIVFDKGFGDDSHITIYDYINQKMIDEIIIDGGCGLRNITRIPEY